MIEAPAEELLVEEPHKSLSVFTWWIETLQTTTAATAEIQMEDKGRKKLGKRFFMSADAPYIHSACPHKTGTYHDGPCCCLSGNPL